MAMVVCGQDKKELLTDVLVEERGRKNARGEGYKASVGKAQAMLCLPSQQLGGVVSPLTWLVIGDQEIRNGDHVTVKS